MDLKTDVLFANAKYKNWSYRI